MLEKINKILNKLAEYASLTPDQKKEFFKNITEGLILNLISDGENLVSRENLENLKASPNEENLKKYFEEMSKNENSKEKVAQRLMELLEEILNPIIPKLSKDQKAEILTILEEGKVVE